MDIREDGGRGGSGSGYAQGGRGVEGGSPGQERGKIWYACTVMGKHMSSYIGRPVAISARDFDTELPNEDALSSNTSYRQLMEVRHHKTEEDEFLESRAAPNTPPETPMTYTAIPYRFSTVPDIMYVLLFAMLPI